MSVPQVLDDILKDLCMYVGQGKLPIADIGRTVGRIADMPHYLVPSHILHLILSPQGFEVYLRDCKCLLFEYIMQFTKLRRSLLELATLMRKTRDNRKEEVFKKWVDKQHWRHAYPTASRQTGS